MLGRVWGCELGIWGVWAVQRGFGCLGFGGVVVEFLGVSEA